MLHFSSLFSTPHYSPQLSFSKSYHHSLLLVNSFYVLTLDSLSDCFLPHHGSLSVISPGFSNDSGDYQGILDACLFHETVDDEGNGDSTHINLSWRGISNPFCPGNITFDLDEEPKDVCLNRFHQRLGSILGFKTKRTASEESTESWLCRDFTQPIGEYSPKDILEIFEEVIPKKTSVILGYFKLTPKYIFTLPEVNPSPSWPGVYLIIPGIGLRSNSIDSMDQKRNVPSGLYEGSSLKTSLGAAFPHRPWNLLYNAFHTQNDLAPRYPDDISLLMKTIYGLKQSPRERYTFKTFKQWSMASQWQRSGFFLC